MPQPKSSGARKGRAKPRKAAPKGAAKKGGRSRTPKHDDQQLRTSLTALRELLVRGVMLPVERMQDALDDAVRRGRMTRDDAEELARNLMAAGRKQTEDLLIDVEQLLGRRLGSDSSAKQAPGAARGKRGGSDQTDKVLRQVDRARRAAGIGQAFPILSYDDLTAAQVTERLADLAPAELRKVRDHGKRNANRKSVLGAVERKLT